ncbi:hypothetical protein Nepgr_006695 [Nepenthes gracilis]|uniref:Uncharacterized protein n=1 Tax=Nepenthes gracilis TaxID=150966 RepID=A0AAD3S5L6_NEPGR|nr:hypothetical protein Nepgr_006695 [Nepenthes gracilis]
MMARRVPVDTSSHTFSSAIWLVLPAFALCCVEPNADPLWCADVGLVLTSWLLGFLGGVCVVALKLHPAACLFPEDVGNGGWCAAVPGIGVSAAFVAVAHKIYLELACYAVWVLTCNLQHRLGESPFYTCLAYGPFTGMLTGCWILPGILCRSEKCILVSLARFCGGGFCWPAPLLVKVSSLVLWLFT